MPVLGVCKGVCTIIFDCIFLRAYNATAGMRMARLSLTGMVFVAEGAKSFYKKRAIKPAFHTRTCNDQLGYLPAKPDKNGRCEIHVHTYEDCISDIYSHLGSTTSRSHVKSRCQVGV